MDIATTSPVLAAASFSSAAAPSSFGRRRQAIGATASVRGGELRPMGAFMPVYGMAPQAWHNGAGIRAAAGRVAATAGVCTTGLGAVMSDRRSDRKLSHITYHPGSIRLEPPS